MTGAVTCPSRAGANQSTDDTIYTLNLHAVDQVLDWQIRFSPSFVKSTPIRAEANATIEADTTELYLACWNRPFNQVSRHGDETVISRFLSLPR
ncbi:MAG: hypothetical protein ACYDHP_10000 [Ferrimicrobium sp.]